MSLQPSRPHPQARGTAASRVRKGTPVKTPTRTRSNMPVGSGSISRRDRARGGVSTGASDMRHRSLCEDDLTYETVTYACVGKARLPAKNPGEYGDTRIK